MCPAKTQINLAIKSIRSEHHSVLTVHRTGSLGLMAFSCAQQWWFCWCSVCSSTQSTLISIKMQYNNYNISQKGLVYAKLIFNCNCLNQRATWICDEWTDGQAGNFCWSITQPSEHWSDALTAWTTLAGCPSSPPPNNRERSGRVLDWRPRGRGFEPHRRHCVVSLSKNINHS